MYNLLKIGSGRQLIRSFIHYQSTLYTPTTTTASSSSSSAFNSLSFRSFTTETFNNNDNNNNKNTYVKTQQQQQRPDKQSKKKPIPEWKEKKRLEKKKGNRLKYETKELNHSRKLSNNQHYSLDLDSFDNTVSIKTHPIYEILCGNEVEHRLKLYVTHISDKKLLHRDLSKLTRSRFEGIPEENTKIYLQFLEDFMISRRSEMDWTEALSCNIIQAHLVRGHLPMAERVFDRFRSVSSLHCILMHHVRNQRPLLAINYLAEKISIVPTYGSSNLCTELVTELSVNPSLKSWTNNFYLKNLTSIAMDYQKELENAYQKDLENEISSGGSMDQFIGKLNMMRSNGSETIAALIVYNQLAQNIPYTRALEHSLGAILKDTHTLNKVLNIIIAYYLQMDRYEMALKWYARRLDYGLSPDYFCIFYFMRYHQMFGQENTPTGKFWNTQRFDHIFNKRLDETVGPEFNKCFLNILTNNLQFSEIGEAVFPSIQPYTKEDDLLTSFNSTGNTDGVLQVLRGLFAEGKLPSGTLLIRSVLLLFNLHQRGFLDFLDSMPKEIRSIVFTSSFYSNLLKRNLNIGTAYLRNENKILYSNSPMILNDILVGLARCHQMDLAITMLSKMMQHQIFIFDWAATSVCQELIVLDLYPEQLLLDLEVSYSRNAQPAIHSHIKNCHLNNMINTGQYEEALIYLRTISIKDLNTYLIALKLFKKLKTADSTTTTATLDATEMQEFLRKRLVHQADERYLHHSIILFYTHNGMISEAKQYFKDNYDFFRVGTNLDIEIMSQLINDVLSDDPLACAEIFKSVPKRERYPHELLNKMRAISEQFPQDDELKRVLSKAWTFVSKPKILSPSTVEFLDKNVISSLDSFQKYL